MAERVLALLIISEADPAKMTSKPTATTWKGGRRRRGFRQLFAYLLSLSLIVQSVGPALAMPQGGNVVTGDGTIQSDGHEMTVEQHSERLAIHWDSFDIGAGETVTFQQPGASSIVLNRVSALDPSEIHGHLQANGQIFLINPNGVIFGDGASVHAAGFVASTLTLDDDDFFNGAYTFDGNGASGKVVNRGRLTADEGGYIALLGHAVENTGEIVAPNGQVALAAGETVLLYLDESGLFKAEVDAAAVGAHIQNGGLIAAEGGSVLLTARAKDALVDTVINHTGIIDASSMESRGGVIVLSGGADGGTVEVSGTLDASGATSGGIVETSGAFVQIDESARVSTQATSGSFGTWIIDPSDYVIAAGDPNDGSSYMSNTALSNSLELSDIEIVTTEGSGGSGEGNIIVDGPISWNAGTTLTLRAHNAITINENITATSDESELTLLVGQDADITLDGEKRIEVGTLTVGGNPDAMTSIFKFAGEVWLHGELQVGTFNVDRTNAIFVGITATHANNSIGKLESSGQHSFGLLNVSDSTGGLDVVLDVQGVETPGNITVRTQGDLTLLAGSKLDFDYGPIDVVFVADGGAFINEAGAEAIVLNPEDHQRFLIYSANPETTLTGGLKGLAVYGKTYDANHGDFSSPDGISRFIFAPGDQPTLILIAKDLERFYGDPNPAFDSDSWEVVGLAEGESLYDVLFGGDPTLSTTADENSPANTATGYPISIVGPGLSSNKYELRFQNGILRVKPAPVTLHIGDTERVYGETEWVAPPSVTVTDGLKLGHTVEDLDITFPTYNQDPTRSVLDPSTPISVKINNSNYTIANPRDTGRLTIRKAELTGQINTVTREYGAAIVADSVLASDVTWTGFKNLDDWRVLTASFDDQAPTAGVGNYPLTGSAIATNYDVTLLDGNLTIVPAPLDIFIHDAQRAYGAADPAFSSGATNLRNGDALSDVFSGQYTTAATLDSGVGDYDITLVNHTMISDNYTLRNVESGTLTITPATLQGTIGRVQREYGESLTSSDLDYAKHYGITWSGFKNADGPSLVDLSLDDHPLTADVGVHSLSGTASADNYHVILIPGELEITPAPLVGQIGEIERTYGDLLSGSSLDAAIAEITWSGFKNGDNASSIDVALDDQPRSANVGEYTLSGSATAHNYAVTLLDGRLTITPATLQGTIGRVQREYGEALTSSDLDYAKHYTVTWNGFKNADGPSVVDLSLIDHPLTADVGVYSLIGTASADNYHVTLIPGELEITPAPLVGQIGEIERTYGDLLSGSSLDAAIAAITWSGFKNGDNASLIHVALKDQPRNANAGDHNWSGSATAKNYAVTLLDGVFTITPAVIHLWANDATRVYGEPNPPFSLTVTGTKFDESPESILQYSVISRVNSKTTQGSYTIGVQPPDAPTNVSDDVVIRVDKILSPNYVVGDVTPGTLVIRPGTIQLSTNRSNLCFDCATGQFQELKQAAESGRGSEVIEVGDYVSAHLTENNQTLIDAIEETISSLLDGETEDADTDLELLVTFLEGIRNGEMSIASWRAAINGGSPEAKAAYASVLPTFALHLLSKDEETLTAAERTFLREIGVQITENRRKLAERSRQLLEEHNRSRSGLITPLLLDVPDVVSQAAGEMSEEIVEAWKVAIGFGAGIVGAAALEASLYAGLIPFAEFIVPFVTKAALEKASGVAAAASASKLTSYFIGPILGTVVVTTITSIQAGILADESQQNMDSYRQAQEMGEKGINSALDLKSGGISEAESLEVALAVVALLSGGDW